MLPLRVALRNKVTTPIIMDLIQADPQSVETFGLSGKTVLHLACMYHSDLAVVDRILSKYYCSHTLTASHLVIFLTLEFIHCCWTVHSFVCSFNTGIWPESAAWKDRAGWHPLHLACLCRDSDSIIASILDIYPTAAALTCTHDQELPIHLAALHGASPKTLVRLHKAYPEGIMRPTKVQRWLPLHLACQRGVEPEIIRTLLEIEPEAAKLKSKMSGCLPLQIATKNGCSDAVIQMLIHAFPAAVLEPSIQCDVSLGCAVHSTKVDGTLQELSTH